MLGFIIPFKAKSKSKNWVKDCFLLNQTLESICNQQSKHFKVFVVYSDMPENEMISDYISYIKFPYPFLNASEMDDYNDVVKRQFDDRWGEFMFDQGKRILWGCDHAIKNGCEFIMSVDADDLISNKIADYVHLNKEEEYGWFINKGYILKENNRLMIRVKKNMNQFNGSTNIVNVSRIPKVNFESKSLEDFSFFSAHGYLKDRMLNQYSQSLKPLPFYGLIYYVHKSNFSDVGTILKKDHLKTIIKYIIRGTFISGSLRKEFGFKVIKIND